MRVNLFGRGWRKTHGGAPAAAPTPEEALRRSLLACLLWEHEFYEDGETIADRIVRLVGEVAPEKVAALALEARSEQHLRHAPLLLVSALARRAGGRLVEDAVAGIIQRADELAELLAVHARLNGVEASAVKPKLSAAMKRGLARAFLKFDEYALAKYDRRGPVRLRDALFLCHAKPDTPERDALWKRLVAGELATPDTWETGLSGGADRRETFERLLLENRLGYLALLRNLRAMGEAGCDEGLVRAAILARRGAERVLPFRYVAAARACPRFEPELDAAMLASLAQTPKLPGRTVVVVDVSGSMTQRLSARSDMTRMDAACAVGAIAREICEHARIFATAGDDASRIHATKEVPARRGLALVDAIGALSRPLGGGGIFLTPAMRFVAKEARDAERTIVLTDEQDCAVDRKDSPLNAAPLGRGYLVNVASAKHGVGYKPQWTHVDGWSENVVRFIAEAERRSG